MAFRCSEYAKGLEQLAGLNATRREQRMADLHKRMGQLSRSQELDADASGYEYAVQAGFEPEGCLRSLDVLSRLPGSGLSSETHPSAPDRLTAIQALMAKHPPQALATVGRLRLRTTEPLT